MSGQEGTVFKVGYFLSVLSTFGYQGGSVALLEYKITFQLPSATTITLQVFSFMLFDGTGYT